MVKYRLPGIGGSWALFFGSNIGFDPCLQFLAWAESHHAPGADRYLFCGLGIAARALFLVAQAELPGAGSLHLLAPRQRGPDLLEEKSDHLPRFSLDQPGLAGRCL